MRRPGRKIGDYVYKDLSIYEKRRNNTKIFSIAFLKEKRLNCQHDFPLFFFTKVIAIILITAKQSLCLYHCFR